MIQYRKDIERHGHLTLAVVSRGTHVYTDVEAIRAVSFFEVCFNMKACSLIAEISSKVASKKLTTCLLGTIMMWPSLTGNLS